ncbi:MAG: hypothetical protein A2283_03015 [Lentisphaerae bacterium RIFOXYA12_FULL_48_11]|nr:MAG: hypothetical protein A2283_03015 [Lentisphaerae bacterium RIFOXYA12_FULL_48_11]
MKRLLLSAVICLIGFSFVDAADETGAQAKPETYLILRYFDHAKQMSYKLVTQSEYKALLDELSAETKLWAKAMAASEKAWKADPSTSKKNFPRTAISPKKMQVVDNFTDQEKASTKLTNLESALSESEEAERKRSEEQEKKRTETARKMLGDRATKKKTDDGASDRELLLESARTLFESKLSELSSGTLGSPAPAAPAAEPQAEKKAAK